MKHFTLLFAFVLLALAAPLTAAEVSTAAPAATLEQQAEAPVLPFEMAFPMVVPALIPYCSVVNGTSCTTLGATKRCTDVCHSNLSCTCITFNGTKFWYCDQEC